MRSGLSIGILRGDDLCEARDKFLVENRLGLHTRAATLVAQVASQYHCTIHIKNDKTKAKATSVLELLQLCALFNTELEVVAKGKDALQAVEAIGGLIKTRFGEDS